MEEKFNESTLNRPEGDRLIDAPFVTSDLQEYLLQLKEEEAWKKNDRNAITLFKSESLRIVLVALHAAAELKPPVPTAGVASAQVLDGSIHLVIENQSAEIKQGQLVTFHQAQGYSIRALQDAFFILTVTVEKDTTGDD